MTKFMTMGQITPKQERKKTVFKKVVNGDGKVKDTLCDPNDAENVMFLYSDVKYGDVFLAWDRHKNNRVIFFGEKGDEFD